VAVAAGRAILLILAGAMLGAQAAPSAFDLAGEFAVRRPNGDVSGARFTTIDSVTIVAADRRNAHVSMELSFFNGHMCSIDGMARMEGTRLVLRDPQAQSFDGQPCRLEIWRDGNRLRWDDGDGSCRSNCGARGSFGDGQMRWSARRAIPAAERRRILTEARRPRDP
jgi:hypothetical protein